MKPLINCIFSLYKNKYFTAQYKICYVYIKMYPVSFPLTRENLCFTKVLLNIYSCSNGCRAISGVIGSNNKVFDVRSLFKSEVKIGQ